ncbi:MAG: MFS transporter [Theionarchaea archaeon]|nr:MFS transporter [Theionarchaea archaeon]
MWMVVYILYLLDRGFSMTQVTLLGSVFWLVLVVFEIPTGSVADKVGKKASLLCSCILSAVGLIFFGLAHSFGAVLIAYTIWAIGVTFESGAASAFLYDSLKEMGREEDYTKIMGGAMSVSFISASIGSVAAGILGEISLNAPILATGVISAALFFLTLTFHEPRIVRTSESYLLHVKSSVQYASHNPQVKAVIFYYALAFSVLWALQIFYQPYLQNIGFTVGLIGVIYFFKKLIGAAASAMAPRIQDIVGEWNWLKLFPFMLFASIFFMGMTTAEIGVSLIFTHSFLSAVSTPIISGYINKRIPSEKRATILSLMNLVNSLMMIPTEPILGWYADHFGLSQTFYVTAVAFLPLMVIVLWFWKQHNE